MAGETDMSDTHVARVIRIGEIRPHPNADKLELTTIGEGEGYQMVIGKGQFKTGDLAVFIQPESIVPQTEPFRFIWQDHVGTDGKVPERRRLINPKRLRGEWSEGLLMPAVELPELRIKEGEDVVIGKDVAEIIGVTHYVPEFDREPTAANTLAAPKRRYPRTWRGWFYWSLMKLGFRRARKNYAIEVAFNYPIYDLNALKNAGRHGFHPGENIQVTEKIHGSNARYVYVDGVQYCGSHEQWKADGPNVWWNVYRQFLEIGDWCHQNPGKVLYGEVGPTQKGFRYGTDKDKTFFFAFDVYCPDAELKIDRSIWRWPGGEGFAPTVPVIHVGPYDPKVIQDLVDGPSVVPGAGHIREGIVVRSLETGRKLKVKSNEFLKIVGNR
jgi:tRNA-binding EMAP/Myf-like protein